MDDHARGLVEDDQVAVLVEDAEREILRLGGRGHRSGELELDLLAPANAGGGLHRLAEHPHLPGLDQVAQAGAAEIGERGDEVLIEPLAPRLGRHGVAADLGAHQIFDFTCPFERTTMSTIARSKKFVVV